MARSEFVDKNIILSRTRVGEPLGLVTTWLPREMFCGHVTVDILTRLTALATPDIDTELQCVPVSASVR